MAGGNAVSDEEIINAQYAADAGGTAIADAGGQATADAMSLVEDRRRHMRPLSLADGMKPLELEHFTIGVAGLQVRGEPSFGEWQGIGELLTMMNHGIQFAIGDWLAYGEGTFGDKADQVIDSGRFSFQSCNNFRWVSKQVPLENRGFIGKPLHWTHYQAVAALPAAEQIPWLEKAAGGTEGGVVWSVAQLKQEIAATSEDAVVCHLLVVECVDSAERERLVARLESEGMTVRRTEVSRKKPVTGPVTARKRRKS